ncbi:MAG: VOC family protein [Acidimicrobiales bacterium]
MPERQQYEPGTPCWVDISSGDLDATKAFYAALFGWETFDYPQEEAGGYGMFLLRGKHVAGYGPTQDEAQPTAWTTYMSVDDADDTAARVEKAGGAVLIPPMDVFDAGRMAIFADPTGGVFGVWQPRGHIGADVVNEPSSLTWNELTIRDPEAGKAFYTEVFGWTAEASAMGGGVEYTVLNLGDRSIGGLLPMGEQFPAEVPTYWNVYFAVADCDESAKKVEELGGKVTVPPTTMEGVGRMAVVSGPAGEAFTLMKNEGPTT